MVRFQNYSSCIQTKRKWLGFEAILYKFREIKWVHTFLSSKNNLCFFKIKLIIYISDKLYIYFPEIHNRMRCNRFFYLVLRNEHFCGLGFTMGCFCEYPREIMFLLLKNNPWKVSSIHYIHWYMLRPYHVQYNHHWF